MGAEWFDIVIDRTGTNCAKVDEMAEKYGEGLLHCRVADMDFQAPLPIRRELQKVVEHGIFGYTNLPADYRTLVGNRIREQYGCPVKEEWVVFSPRINMGLNMAVETLTKPGDAVIVFSPAYPALTDAVVKYGRTLLETPLIKEGGKWRMDVKGLESRMDGRVKMLILCSPHNPVGRVWTLKELKEIETFCLKHDLYLLCDEIHADIRRKGIQFHSILELSQEMQKKMIVYQSMTKTCNIPGILFSNMVIPDETVRKKMQGTIDRHGLHNPNIFAAAVMRPAYTECEEWIKAVNTYIDKNLAYLDNFLKQHLPEFEMDMPEGTFLAWISFKKTGWTDEETEGFFVEKVKASVYMGNHFGNSGSGYIRLNVGMPQKKLKEVLDKMLILR